eukprot:6490427-Amphidinium_carterae.1
MALLRDPWSFLESPAGHQPVTSTPVTSTDPGPEPGPSDENGFEPDAAADPVCSLLETICKVQAEHTKLLTELRLAQTKHTAQLVDCLGSVASALEKSAAQQAILLARSPPASPTPHREHEQVAAKARPKPSTRPIARFGGPVRPIARVHAKRRPTRLAKGRGGTET